MYIVEATANIGTHEHTPAAHLTPSQLTGNVQVHYQLIYIVCTGSVQETIRNPANQIQPVSKWKQTNIKADTNGHASNIKAIALTLYIVEATANNHNM